MNRLVAYVHFVPERGGSGTSLSLLVKHLDRVRYRACVIQAHPSLGSALDVLRETDVPIDHVPVPLVWNQAWWSETNLRGRAWRAFQASDKAEQCLRRLNPAIVHLNDFPPIPFAIAANRLGIPVVWHSRLMIRNGPRLLLPGRRIMSEMIRRSCRIIAISETEAGQFPTEKVRVIYNPLDMSRIEAARGKRVETRAALGVGAGQFMVVAPVALSTAKGAWDYIEACGVARNQASGVDFRFFLTGSVSSAGRRHALRRRIGIGPEADHSRLERILTRLGIADRFTLTGFRTDVYEIMDAADLVVFPSRLRACGRPCFEAGALGRPVIVTMPTRNTSVIRDGITGTIAPEANPAALGSEIARYATDAPLARRVGEAARAYVPAAFDADQHARRIMEVYDEVLQETGT